MKKIIFTLYVFYLWLYTPAAGQSCEGPALFFEDFNAGVPTGWTILNLDTNTMYFSNAVKGYTGEWQPYNHYGRHCVSNTSRYAEPTDAPDDYLITPTVHLGTGAPICLSWKSARAFDHPSFSDEEYEVLISVSGPTLSGLQANPELEVVIEPEAEWTSYWVDLSAYAGMDVNIGFWHNTPGYGYALSLDDVRIAQPVAQDVSVIVLNVSDAVLPGAVVPLTGTLLNGGLTTLQSFTLNWKADNGAVTSQSFTGLSIPAQSYHSFSFSSAWTAPGTGTYKLKVWADNLNGSGDLYHNNDTLSSYVFVNTRTRKVLNEEFTQASCPPCATENPAYDFLLETNRQAGKVTMIKYHEGWPGVDPMFDFNTPDAIDRVIAHGITALPMALINGKHVQGCGAYNGQPSCLTQAIIDSAHLIPSPFDIQISTSKNGPDYSINFSVTALTDFPLTSFRVYTVLVEDMIEYLVPPGTNGEIEFPQVMRKMLPTSDGVLLPPLGQGQSFTQSFLTPIEAEYVEEELRVVVFVEDNATRKIYQSEMTDQAFTGIDDLSGGSIIRIYPVPAHNYAYVSLPAVDGDFSITLLDMTGRKLRFSELHGRRGDVHKMDLTGIPPGIYSVLISDKEFRHREKLVVE